MDDEKRKGTLIWSVTRLVPFLVQKSLIDQRTLERVLQDEFMTAYRDLRSSCPKGDLRIHLSVEGSPEEVGASLL
jgi:hypothetical protein